LPDPDGGDLVNLAIKCSAKDAEGIVTKIKKLLPASEHPDRVFCLSSLPTLASGKVDMLELQTTIEALIAGGPVEN
jgi:hypothetical protein